MSLKSITQLVAAASCLYGSLSADVVPVRGIAYTTKDIPRVRQIAATDPIYKTIAGNFVRKADAWLQRDWQEIMKLMPPDNAVYAYGFAGDPKTNEAWSWWGRDGEASIEHPGVVRSLHTGDVYGKQKPGEAFYDDGNGWVRPADKKVFFFKGIWHSYIIRQLHEAVDSLSIAYLLTGNDAYAERALLLLDHFATMRSRRPDTDGPADWPRLNMRNYSFFVYTGNVANMRMIASALALDLVGRVPAAERPSAGNPELTVFENIRQNYFDVFESIYLERKSSFQNHASAAFASMLTQAVLFGEPERIRLGIEAAYGFIDNTIDRDGEYYEISASYGYLGRIYGSRLLLPLQNYSPQNYDNPQQFPDPADYPLDLHFGDDPVWFNTVVQSMYRLTTLYRQSQYGDAAADRIIPSQKRSNYETLLQSIYARQKVIYLKNFYHMTTYAQWKELCALLYWLMPESLRNNTNFIETGILEFGASQWGNLPHKENASLEDLPNDLREDRSIVTGQKGIAILRSGQGSEQRAIFVRGGTAASHAHDDQMAITLYGKGLSLTGEYGYKLYGTPDHRGWGIQRVAHKMVVVNEGLDAPIPADALPASTDNPPARIEGYVPFPPAQLIEMANPEQWQGAGLNDYRRQVWLIDQPDARDGYYVDIFWVEGGRTHDYVWNAPFINKSDAHALNLEGIRPEAVDGVWSLPALNNPEYREASFNQPGKSWGELLEAGSGTIRNLDATSKRWPSRNWSPPPGNGYGFIWDVKAANTDTDWSAVWLLHDQRHSLKLSALNPDGGQQVITAKTPTLTSNRAQDTLIIRRKSAEDDGNNPLYSRFVTVSQLSDSGKWPISSVRWLGDSGNERNSSEQQRNGNNSETGNNNVAIAVTHASGEVDTVLASKDGKALHSAGITLEGRRGFIRRDKSGAVTAAMLSEGTALLDKDFSLRLPASAWHGIVTAVSNNKVYTNIRNLPPAAALREQGILFDSPADAKAPCSGNQFFTIEQVENTDGGAVFTFANQSVSLSRIRVVSKSRKDGNAVIHTEWPNELAAIPHRRTNRNRLFEGRLLMAEANPSQTTTVQTYLNKKSLRVTEPENVLPNRFYRIMATRPEDSASIAAVSVIRRIGEDQWLLRANMDVTLRLPGNPPYLSVSSGGSAATQLTADKDGSFRISVALLTNGSAVLDLAKQPQRR